MDFSNLVTKAKNSITDYLGIPDADRAQGPYFSDRVTNTKLFKYTITSSQHGQFSGRLPDSVSYNIASSYKNLMEGKSPILSALDTVMQSSGFGITTRTKFTSAQLWSGSSPVELTLPIELMATHDVDQEVLLPMLRLGSMVLPREGGTNVLGNLLRAPGPRPIDLDKAAYVKPVVEYIGNKVSQWSGNGDWKASDSDDNITVAIGNILYFERCIIDKVDWTIHTKQLLAGTGKPLSVTGNVHIRTSYSITNKEFYKQMLANSINKSAAQKNQSVSQKGR